MSLKEVNDAHIHDVVKEAFKCLLQQRLNVPLAINDAARKSVQTRENDNTK